MRALMFGWLLGVLTPLALGLGMAWLGLLPSRANAPQPEWTKAVSQMALYNYVARQAPRAVSPFASTENNLMAGLKVFKTECSGCHGNPGSPSAYGGSFYPAAPQFADVPPRLPVYELFWIIRNGVRYSGMQAHDRGWDNDEAKSDEQIWTVALFLSQLDTLPRAVNAAWHEK